METVPKKGDAPVLTAGKGISWMAALKRDKWLYLLLIPGLLYFLIFKYLPMWGVLIAFKDYSPYLGFWKSEWVGFDYFKDFFMNPDFSGCCATPSCWRAWIFCLPFPRLSFWPCF